ncbi:MAG: zinc finger domain-containing protein [Candidatus Thermoplasmatota archaeon]|nr:zinc finger domain-containing protein [Candidatus Thermoplasmatota archaeon]
MGTRDTCSSCGRGLVEVGFSIFDCPECGDSIIGRCRSCREHSTKYTCEKCGYTSM